MVQLLEIIGQLFSKNDLTQGEESSALTLPSCLRRPPNFQLV